MFQQKRFFLKHLFAIILCLLTLKINAQRPFFSADTTLNKMKVGLVAGSSAAIFTGALLVLNQYWYKDYPRSKFHFFDDGREWQGIDKAGHVYNAYVQSRWSVGMYRWAGLKDKQAIWAGGATGIFLQSSIEILDGFSEEWGYSWWDFAANTMGSAIVVGQELLWNEQRITLKVSAFPQNYPNNLQERADKLYGTTTLELFLKDYNALTTWASFNISSFIQRDTKFPKWINAAFGYGAQGMYGGFENKWCVNEAAKYDECPDGLKIDRSDIQRYKQYYLSLDVDWTKIPVKRKGWKVLFSMMNLVKLPFPAVEFNRVDKVRFRPFHF